MGSTRRAVAACALLSLGLATGTLARPAVAQPAPDDAPDAPGEADEAQEHDPQDVQQDDAPSEADALIDEGVQLRTEGREREALERFRRAYELEPSPRARAQMGLAEKSLRSYLEAEAHLDEALASDDPWVEANRAALQAARSFVVKQLAWVRVTTNVPRAELRVNGAMVGEIPSSEPHRVVAGRAVVEARAEGYAPSRRDVALAAEETTELSLTLSRAEPRPAVPAPGPARPPADAGVEPASWTPWILGTGALGVVGLAVGTGLGVRALQLKSERDEVCPNPECETEEGLTLDDQGRAMATGSTIAFTVGGLAAAASLVLWLLEPDEPVATAVVGPQGGGLAIRF